METETLQNSKKAAGHGYMRLIIGAVLIFTGAWVFLTPVKADKDFSVIFASAFLSIGLIEIIYVVFNMKTLNRWGWLLAGGIADMLIGGRLALHPQIFMVVLPVFISFVIFLRSVMAIIWFVELRKRNTLYGRMMLAVGVLGLIAAVVLFFSHALAGLRFVQGTSAAFIVIGIFEIYLSFCLKKLRAIDINNSVQPGIIK